MQLLAKFKQFFTWGSEPPLIIDRIERLFWHLE